MYSILTEDRDIHVVHLIPVTDNIKSIRHVLLLLLRNKSGTDVRKEDKEEGRAWIIKLNRTNGMLLTLQQKYLLSASRKICSAPRTFVQSLMFFSHVATILNMGNGKIAEYIARMHL